MALIVKNKIEALRCQQHITYRQNKQTPTNGLPVDSESES